MDYLKPLFNDRLLGEALRESPMVLDDEQRRIATNWATSAANDGLRGQKEKPLQGQFLSEIFDRLLGYHQIVGADGAHHMEPETSSTSVKGYRPPDTRLGWFGATVDRTGGSSNSRRRAPTWTPSRARTTANSPRSSKPSATRTRSTAAVGSS